MDVERINLAMIINEDFVNRFGRIISHNIVGLLDQAVNITLIMEQSIDVNIFEMLSGNIIRYRKTLWPGKYKRTVESIAEELKKSKVNLIHSLTGRMGRLAHDIAREADLPYIVSFTGVWQEECYIPIDKERCKHLIALSKPIEEELKDIYKSAVSISLIRPGCFVQDKTDFPKNKTKTFVSVGSFDRHSRYEVLIEIFSKLKSEGYDFFLVLFGKGSYESGLYKLISKHNLTDSVIMLDILSGWEKVLAESYLYIQPAPEYSLRDPLYQAIAYGCPVVGPKGSVYDVILEGRTGRLFEPDDFDGLMDIIRSAFAEEESWKKLSRTTLEFAKDELSIVKATEKLLDVCGNSFKG